MRWKPHQLINYNSDYVRCEVVEEEKILALPLMPFRIFHFKLTITLIRKQKCIATRKIFSITVHYERNVCLFVCRLSGWILICACRQEKKSIEAISSQTQGMAWEKTTPAIPLYLCAKICFPTILFWFFFFWFLFGPKIVYFSLRLNKLILIGVIARNRRP